MKLDDIVFAPAKPSDLKALIELLYDDELGEQREVPASESAYRAALNAIDRDPSNVLIVGRHDGVPVAMLQLTFIPSLSYEGGWRAQIENVRVHRDYRDQGLGRKMLLYAVDRAHSRGCRVVQLTTDHRRPEAKAFYESLGFGNTHYGMKLFL